MPTFELLERYCDRAASLGMTQLAITEHSDRFGRILDDVMPHWERPPTGTVADATARVLSAEGRADLDTCVSALQAAKQAGLPILVGLEVDSILDLATSGTVDVLAHLDVIKVAGHKPPHLAEHEHRLVQGLADADVIIEFSSAGFRKPVNDTYPSTHLLDALLANGAGLTTASDGHTLEQIGAGFDHIAKVLNERGLTELATFDQRRRIGYQR